MPYFQCVLAKICSREEFKIVYPFIVSISNEHSSPNVQRTENVSNDLQFHL